MRILVDSPSGLQHFITVESPGARYFDKDKVLWDERVDGLFPENMLTSVGGLERVAGELVVNATKLSAAQAATAAANASKTQKEQRVVAAKLALNQANLANGDADLTPQQIRQLFRFIRVILKDVGKQLD